MSTQRGYSDGIRRLRSGKYQVRVRVAGRIHKQSLPTLQSAQTVRNYLRTRNAAARLGIPEPPPPAGPLSLEEAFDRYLAKRRALGRTPKSIQQIEYVKALWSQALGKRHPAALTHDELVAFVAWARAGNMRSTRGRAIQLAIGVVRSVIASAGLPVPKAPAVDVLHRQAKTVAATAVVRFLAELPAGSLERTFAETVFRTARRETEVRRLRIGDVDLDGLTLTFQRLKGRHRGEERHPIGATLAEVLRVYLASQCQGLPPEAPLFGIESVRAGRRERHPLTEWSLSKRLAPAAERAGVGKRVRTLGWLRNQAATDARRRGTPVDEVSMALGHADVSTTLKHYVEDRRWAARSALAGQVDAEVPAPGYTPSAGDVARKRGTRKAPGRARRGAK